MELLVRADADSRPSNMSQSHSFPSGFGYEVNAIRDGRANELAEAFHAMTESLSETNIWHILVHFFPVLEIIVSIPPLQL